MSKLLRSLLLTSVLFFLSFFFGINSASAKSSVKEVEKAAKPVEYSMGVTDAQGCSASLTVSPSVICNGQCTNLTATGSGGSPYAFQWSSNPASAGFPQSGSQASNTAVLNVCPTVTTTYTVTVTSGWGTTAQCGSPVVKSVTVTVNPNPVAQAGPDGSYCNGMVITLGGTASTIPTTTGSGGTSPYTYSWGTTGSAISSTTGANPTSTGTANTTYTVTVTDNKGCTATDNAVWTFKTITANVTPNPTSVCAGGCANLTANGSGGSGSYTYSWAGNNISGSATANPISACPATTASTTYTVTVTESPGCTATATGTITTGNITVTVADKEICAGTSTTMTAVTGASGPNFVWSGTISGSNLVNPVSTPTMATGTYAYTVTVTDGSGCTATATGKLTVNPNPVVTTVDPGGIYCLPASCYTINNVYGGGTGALGYAWSPSGAGPTPCVTPPGGITTYSVIVTDAKGCTASASTDITVRTLSLNVTASPNAVCPGTETTTLDAAVTTNPAPNAPPFVYNWTGCDFTSATNIANPTARPLTACMYQVTVTDANGCQTTGSVNVTIKTITASANAVPNPVCPGGTTTITATEGGSTTNPLGYNWTGCALSSTSIQAPNANPLATCTYNVTITDANGCSATANTVVNVNPVPTPSVTPTFVCEGVSATLNANVGACVGCTFDWTDGTVNVGSSNPLTVTPLTTTTYYVTVTDGAGCTGTAEGVVTVNPNPVAMAEPGTPPFAICLGQSFTLGGNASTTPNATATDGTPGYGYNWTSPVPGGGSYNPSGSNSNPIVTPTAAGTYIYGVTVTDANSCTATDNVTLAVNGPPIADAGPDEVLCNGESWALGGTPTASLGTGPTYTYNWTPTLNGLSSTIASNPTITGTINTVYDVTVTDAAGCTATDQISITVLSPMDVTGTFTPATCGSSDGSVTCDPSGGTGFYSYNWTPGPYTTQTVNGVAGGAYTVVVTDTEGCTASVTVNVADQGGPTVTILSQTDVTCFGANDGTATIEVAAGTGTPDFTYRWPAGGPTPVTSPSLTNSVSGLPPGSHTVTVTDANGCLGNVTIDITEPPALTLTLTNTPPSCAGTCDGTATATAGGGTPGYTYLWSDAQTGSVAVGLCPGPYSVTITDANGCTKSASTTINSATPIVPAISAISHISCNGLCDGSATVTASGASGTYGFTWSTGTTATGTGSTETGLCVGSYTVTVSDFSNATCLQTIVVTITEPPVLTLAQGATTGAPCGGNGTTCVTASGGASLAINYVWAPVPVAGGGPAASTTGAAICITGTAGAYLCSVTDANGCTATINSVINNVGGPSVTLTVTNASVANNDGSIDACAVSGGTSPYTYAWDVPPAAGQTGCTATGLPAGPYCVTITDAMGCVAVACTTVSSPPPLGITIVKHPPVCFGGAGTVDVTANGGTAPFDYEWTAPTPSAIPGCTSIPGMCVATVTAGTYTVKVTDFNGTTADLTFTITQPTQLTATASPTHVTCFGSPTGAICINASGGTQFLTANKYDFAWSSVGTNNPCATGLAAGPYTITVTDRNGCTASVSQSITQAPNMIVSANVNSHISCPLACDGKIDLTVTSGGTPPYNYLWAPSGKNGSLITSGMTSTLTGFCAGSTTVTVTDFANCSKTAVVTITQPLPITFGPSTFTPPLCNGGSGTGQIVVSSGGTPPFSYSWPAPAIKTSPVTTGLTGSTASGLVVTGTPPTPYVVKVTDKNGCTENAPVINFTEPSKVGVNITSFTNPTCFGFNDGSITAAGFGGQNTTYTYAWAPLPATGTGATAGGLTGTTGGTTYTVIASDANGCTSTAASQVITAPPAMTVAVTSYTDVSCYGYNDGSINTNPVGGNGGNVFAWSSSPAAAAATGPNPTGLTSVSPGGVTYTITVTDMLGCSATTSQLITQPDEIIVSTVVTDVLCKGGNTGSIFATTIGGSGVYTTHNWAPLPATTGNPANNLTLGTYSVTVTDNAGCTGTAQATVNEPLNGLSVTMADGGLACNGNSDGTLTANPFGGTPGYSFSWSPAPAAGQTGSTATNLNSTGSGAPGKIYTVIVTDANNCTAAASASITQPGAMVVSASAVSPVCYMQTSNLTVSVVGGTFTSGTSFYSWSNDQGNAAYNAPSVPTLLGVNPSATGTTGALSVDNTTIGYTVVVTDDNGCTANANTNVFVRPRLTATVTPNSTDVCAGSSTIVTLTANPSGGLAPSPSLIYSWSDNPTGTLLTSTGVSVNAQPTTAGTYTYTVTVQDNCSPNATATATIIARPAPYAPIATPVNGCDPAPVTLDVNLTDPSATGINNALYSWTVQGNSQTSFQNGPSAATAYSNTYTYADGSINPSDKSYSTYTANLVITSQYPGITGGCSSIVPISSTFQIYQNPVVRVVPGSVSELKPEALFNCVQINTFTKIAQYSWDFGDLTSTTTTSPSVIHLYPDVEIRDNVPVSYTVTVDVVTDKGCPGTYTFIQLINPETSLWIPEAFTPNGDGKNDVFGAWGYNITNCEMFIYDRWGNLIFESYTLEDRWDGRAHNGGGIAQQDVYIYKITIVDSEGKKMKPFVGKITLIR